MGDRDYFAIGLKNNKGGWELRNSFQKLCSSPKSITHFKNGKEKLVVVEGMFDFLSLKTMVPSWLKDSDILVLNSLAFANQLENFIGYYKECGLLLDNDDAGDRMTKTLLEKYDNLSDGRNLFKGFKDLNEKLQSDHLIKTKKDVSLNNIF